MRILVKAGRRSFAICLAGLAAQQLYYGEFRPVFVPAWPHPIPGQAILVYLTSAALLLSAGAIFFEKKGRTVSLFLGGVFLLLFLFCHTPFEIWVDPYSKHIGVWTNALKDLVFSGGAFVVAASFPPESILLKKNPAEGPPIPQKPSALLRLLELFIPLGPVFFSITMIIFGIDHFLYTDFVMTLVPAWIPGPHFWTVFAAVALIGAGAGIMLRIQLKPIAFLLGTMIFLWLILLHIPRAAIAPVTDKGNELTSVFEALGFSGIAFVIACVYEAYTFPKKQNIEGTLMS
jgi:hypothetical protein